MAQTEKGIVYPYDYNEVADVPADLKALAESIDALLNNYSLNTDSGNKIVLEMNNTTYKIKAVLKDKNDNVISTSNEIDLPLENMVTNISYNNQTLTLTHQDGQTTEVSIADLISDLASKEEVTELQSQVDDLTTLVETELDTNTVEGTEIDVSDSAEYRGPVIPGANTKQKQLSGKNLFGIDDYEGTFNGVTVNIKDGEITLNGTAASTATLYIDSKDEQILNGNFTITKNYISGTFDGSGNVNLRNKNDGTIISGTQLSFSIDSRTYTLENGNVKYGIYIMSGTIFNNYKFRPQLVAGSTPDYDFEPYCGGQPSPNPDYPQEIKVVTGDNVIKHAGKNEFYGEKFGLLWWNSSTGNFTNSGNFKSFICRVKTNTQYVISKKNVSNRFIILTSQNEPAAGKPYKRALLTEVDSQRTSYSFTTQSDENYMFFGLYSGTDEIEIAKAIEEIQLEEGTEATSYEPYREEEYKLDLWKENEFDKDNVLSGYNINETTSKIANVSSSSLVYMSCKPNTTYKISKILSSRFGVGTTHEIPAVNSTVYNYIRKDGNTEIIIKTGTQDTYIVAWVHTTTYDTEITVQEILDSIQIQEAIELCKINNYEDIPFKNEVGDENYNAELENGAWYKKGVINKDTYANLSTGRVVVVTSYIKSGLTGFACNINPTHKLGTSAFEVICTHFAQKYLGPINDTTDTNSVRNSEGIALHTGNIDQLVISIDTTKIPEGTATAFDNYIRSINPIIAYIKNTPTYEKITDPTLISQLEALRKAKWFKGVNHLWTETENLEPNLKGTYKQSNNLRIKEQDERLDNLESRLALLE